MLNSRVDLASPDVYVRAVGADHALIPLLLTIHATLLLDENPDDHEEAPMGKLIYDVSMSLDGFITGANPRAEEGWGGLGEGGERLHDWGFNSADPRNHEIMEWYRHMGANIFGRATYDLAIPNWGA